MTDTVRQYTVWIKVCISNTWINHACNGAAAAYDCMDQLDDWCKNNIGEKNINWYWEFPNYVFRSEQDALMFRLANGV